MHVPGPEEEKKPECVIPRIRAMFGQGRDFALEWVSAHTFQCRRMQHFRHGRLLFVGDAAHQVSPFGAGGANSGLQDIDKLVWKLKLMLDGLAPHSLLDTHTAERAAAADANILNSTRSTDFITPKSRTSKTFRNQVLALAKHHPFARKLVNSGRLSVPSFLTGSMLNTPDADAFAGNMVPGAPMDDAPVQVDGQDAWLLDQVGKGFQLLLFVDAAPSPDVLAQLASCSSAPLRANAAVQVTPLIVAPSPLNIPGIQVIIDAQGLVAKRYDAQPGTAYLLRPDQHVLARWRTLDSARLQAALARALGQFSPQA